MTDMIFIPGPGDFNLQPMPWPMPMPMPLPMPGPTPLPTPQPTPIDAFTLPDYGFSGYTPILPPAPTIRDYSEMLGNGTADTYTIEAYEPGQILDFGRAEIRVLDESIDGQVSITVTQPYGLETDTVIIVGVNSFDDLTFGGGAQTFVEVTLPLDPLNPLNPLNPTDPLNPLNPIDPLNPFVPQDGGGVPLDPTDPARFVDKDLSQASDDRFDFSDTIADGVTETFRFDYDDFVDVIDLGGQRASEVEYVPETVSMGVGVVSIGPDAGVGFTAGPDGDLFYVTGITEFDQIDFAF